MELKNWNMRLTEIAGTFLDAFVLHLALFGFFLVGSAVSQGLRILLSSTPPQFALVAAAVTICGIKRTPFWICIAGITCLAASALAWRGQDVFQLLMTMLLLIYTKVGFGLCIVVVLIVGWNRGTTVLDTSPVPPIIDGKFRIRK